MLTSYSGSGLDLVMFSVLPPVVASCWDFHDGIFKHVAAFLRVSTELSQGRCTYFAVAKSVAMIAFTLKDIFK